jgi:glycosyltransferase involved in cell wall biosynthesis
MARIVYIWQKDFPWDVRTEKICLALRDGGHEVTMLVRWSAGSPSESLWKDIRIVRVGVGMPSALSLPVSGNPLWHRALQCLVDEWQPDMLMPREIMLAEAASRCARRRGIPVVIDMAEHYPAAMRGWKKYNASLLSRWAVQTARIPDIVERRAVERASGIITVCEENSERLSKQYGYNAAQMAVVHNTPDTSVFHNVRKGLQHPTLRHFGFHGYIAPERNVEVLVRAFAIAAREHPDLALTIAGDGESMPEVRRAVSETQMHERIRLLGAYKYNELERLYGEIDVGIVVYRNDEFSNFTIPNKLFDYLACGKPVIVSNAAPLKRIVETTKTGLVSQCDTPEPLAQTLLSMAAMPKADSDEASCNGILASERLYNWSVDTQTLLAFVETMLALPPQY